MNWGNVLLVPNRPKVLPHTPQTLHYLNLLEPPHSLHQQVEWPGGGRKPTHRYKQTVINQASTIHQFSTPRPIYPSHLFHPISKDMRIHHTLGCYNNHPLRT